MRPLRSLRQRICQTLAYEITALAIFTPIYYLCSENPLPRFFLLLALISLIAILWAGLFNHLYDHFEYRRFARPASSRSIKGRILHAMLLEFGIVMITMPVIKFAMDYSWSQALAVDAALTLGYVVYGYCFYWAYDKLLPIRTLGCELSQQRAIEG